MSALAQGVPPPRGDWALFLDIDGTLLDHAARPDAVQVAAPVLNSLDALRRATGGALALISGRAIEDIDALFAPLRLPVAGQHGAERRDAAGHLHQYQGAAEPVRRAAARLGAFAARHAGLVFEDKGHSLALHYRQAPSVAHAAQAALRETALELGGDYEVLEGKMVVELKPAGRDKGRAIAEFMTEPPFAGRTPMFIGDDVTDEFGFGVVNRLGGHSVKVGPGPSAARHRVADAAAVRDWLGQWAALHA
jgi:trehalose 6-phosphate phosphatase